jgi:plastocyanin
VATDTLTMVDNAFEPESIAVTSGSTLTVTNDGEALHSFTVEDEGIDQDVQPGESATVDVSLSAGDYPFVCKYHPEMTGSMTVE